MLEGSGVKANAAIFFGDRSKGVWLMPLLVANSLLSFGGSELGRVGPLGPAASCSAAVDEELLASNASADVVVVSQAMYEGSSVVSRRRVVVVSATGRRQHK